MNKTTYMTFCRSTETSRVPLIYGAFSISAGSSNIFFFGRYSVVIDCIKGLASMTKSFGLLTIILPDLLTSTIIIIDYYIQSMIVSCSSSFCESGQQPVVKGLTESLHNDTYNDAFFFSVQVPVSKSLLSPIKLFFAHVLLSS